MSFTPEQVSLMEDIFTPRQIEKVLTKDELLRLEAIRIASRVVGNKHGAGEAGFTLIEVAGMVLRWLEDGGGDGF